MRSLNVEFVLLHPLKDYALTHLFCVPILLESLPNHCKHLQKIRFTIRASQGATDADLRCPRLDACGSASHQGAIRVAPDGHHLLERRQWQAKDTDEQLFAGEAGSPVPAQDAAVWDGREGRQDGSWFLCAYEIYVAAIFKHTWRTRQPGNSTASDILDEGGRSGASGTSSSVWPAGR